MSEKLTAIEIENMKDTPVFRRRYAKYLRKEIRPAQTIESMLDVWFVRFKCTASAGTPAAGGRRDPITNQTLFREETKDAIRNCKINAQYL